MLREVFKSAVFKVESSPLPNYSYFTHSLQCILRPDKLEVIRVNLDLPRKLPVRVILRKVQVKCECILTDSRGYLYPTASYCLGL